MGTTISVPPTINVEEMMLNTGLTRKQICALWTRFNELDRDGQGDAKGYKGYLDADDLGHVPKFDENPIAPRLIKVIFDDFGSNGKLTFDQFVEFMSTFGQYEQIRRRRSGAIAMGPFMTKTDLETTQSSPEDSGIIRKIKFIFRVKSSFSGTSLVTIVSFQMYDVDHDGRLSKEDIEEILKMMVRRAAEQLKDA